jgi:hypothetical protein
MKAGVILTIISVVCIVIGALFKIQHWPIAGFFLICALALWPLGLLVFLVSTLRHPRFEGFMKTSIGPIKARALAQVLIAFTVLACIANIGALFKIQHWPLPGPIWWGFSIVAAVLIWVFMQNPQGKNPAG